MKIHSRRLRFPSTPLDSIFSLLYSISIPVDLISTKIRFLLIQEEKGQEVLNQECLELRNLKFMGNHSPIISQIFFFRRINIPMNPSFHHLYQFHHRKYFYFRYFRHLNFRYGIFLHFVYMIFSNPNPIGISSNQITI